MIGFIGLGACGSNIADEAKTNGIPALAINYSQKDLDSLEHIADTDRLRLVGSEGVGKQREVAVQLMNLNWESAVSFVKERFSSPAIEIILMCFSTGGGSGSGIGPILLDLLTAEMSNKTFVAVPVLPDHTEVMVNQLNCIHASEELSKLEICCLPLDNQKIRDKNHSIGKNTLYKETNTAFIQLIRQLLDCTQKNSKNGILDKRDLQTIFNTKGVMVISEAKLTNLSGGTIDLRETGIAKVIQESWETSLFAPIEYSRLLRAGIIYDGPSLMEFLDLNQIFSKFHTMPLDLFEGYFDGESEKVYTLLSGLKWYHTRLRRIEDLVSQMQEKAKEMLSDSDEYQSKIRNPLRNQLTQKRENPPKRKVSDILSRYIR